MTYSKMERRQVDLVRLLPDDVLADILRRLPPRSLAVSRCVCTWWLALIDDCGILRADLLPQLLAGLVISYNGLEYAELFARPSVDLGDYGMPCGLVQDHCNGLLLLYGWVHNPATGGYATLPKRPAPRDQYAIEYGYLAFDPTISSHFEVLLIPRTKFHRRAMLESALLHSEWPPSPWILSFFSSTTGLWEEKSFIRQGEAAGTVADMQLDQRFVELGGRKAEYWRGALYVHCQTDFIMRISLSNSSYRVIKNPSGFQDKNFVLGRSKKGIYYALLDAKYRLRVWILDESSDDQVDWKLRHDSGRGPAFPPYLSCDRGPWGPWILSNTNCDDESEDEEEAQVEEEFEWNSDDDDDAVILPTDDRVEECHAFSQFRIVAFHPYKEIVFFHRLSTRVLAYHLSSSKLEDLGKLLPLNNFDPSVYMRSCFPYTPCWMDGLPKKSGKPKISMSRIEVIFVNKIHSFSSVRLCFYCMRNQFEYS